MFDSENLSGVIDRIITTVCSVRYRAVAFCVREIYVGKSFTSLRVSKFMNHLERFSVKSLCFLSCQAVFCLVHLILSRSIVYYHIHRTLTGKGNAE